MSALPIVRKKAVWRIGDPTKADVASNSSCEGLGMSVSECPEAWQQIARLSGQTWRLSPKPPRKTGAFLDVYALSPTQVVELTRRAIETGLLRSEWRWKAMWSVEEHGQALPLEAGYEYSFFVNESEAEDHAEAASVDGQWDVRREIVAVPTERLRELWAERFNGRLPDGIAAVVAWQALLEKSRTDLDGFWWNDELDPDGLSAPRGMIFYSKVRRWAWRKASPRRRNADSELRVVCSWCGVKISGSDAPDAKLSHGACLDCKAKFKEQVEEIRRARRAKKAAGGEEPKQKNADEDLRRAERASAAGDPQDEARLLVQRVRAGALDPWIVRAAARLGHPSALATGLGVLSEDELRWSQSDETEARRHGWSVFRTSSRGLEIEGVAEPPEDAVQVFDGPNRDGEAHLFVLSQAMLGDRTSIKALLLIREQPGVQGMNFERAVVMVGQPLFDWLADEGEAAPGAWYEEDLSPHYRNVADRVAAAVEANVAASFLGLSSRMPDVAAILREKRENGWWHAVHRYVSPRERELTDEETWVRDVAYGIKRGDDDAIATAANAMAAFVPAGSFVIPAPASRAGGYGGVSRLAVEIAKTVHGVYAEPVGRERTVPSSHERRRSGGHGLTVDEHVASMGPRGVVPCPQGRPIFVVDNVAASGATLEAVRRVIGEDCDVRAVVWAEALPMAVS